jgi:serine/threonine protein kinase
MGVVYLGEARDCGRVAVKVMRPEVGEDPEFRARFRREVSLLTRVRGTCTVRVVEADTDSATPFLVTEYAEGPSLSEYVKANGPVEPDLLYGLATGLAEALVAIHGAGVVHRDLKPGNVLLSEKGPKVIDFGIAQALDGAGTVLTRTGAVLGSPGFLAPEQVLGNPGQAADVFAWGLTVAYAASGKAPFGTGPAEVLPYRVVHDDPDIADVPDELRPLVEAAVAKDPNARPTAIELLTRLTAGAVAPQPDQDVEAGQQPSAETDGLSPTQLVLLRSWHAPALPEYASSSIQDARPMSRRRRFLPYLAGAAGLAVLIGAGASYVIARSDQPATVTSGQASSVTLPTVTFGSYTGRKPAAIVMNNNSGLGTIENIRWTSWTATGAAGRGQLGEIATQVSLSAPVNGRFTHMGETDAGSVLLEAYPDNEWPTGASDAAAACTTPTPTQLLGAWQTASSAVQQTWAATGARVTGFTDATCWQDWVVAEMIGTGNGVIIFSRSGGALHLVPQSDLQQFSDVICKDPTAPLEWKSPDVGPAIC